jgi:hypothetical protein
MHQPALLQEVPDRPLSAPLPLGDHPFKAWLLFPAGALALCGLALFGISAAVIALAALPVLIASLAHRLRRRLLTVTVQGFELTGWRTRLAVADEQVTGMSQSCNQDEAGRWRVRLELETEVPGARRLSLNYIGRPGRPNPLAPLLERLTRKLARDAQEELAGDGWELAEGELRVPELGLTIRLGEVARVSFHAGSLCVWTHGEVTPALVISARARNVQALARLLAQHAREDPSRPVTHPLGRSLFSLYCEPPIVRWIPFFQQVTFFGALAVGVAARVVFPRFLGIVRWVFVAAFLAPFAVGWLRRFLIAPPCDLQVHERGVVVAGRPLPFDQVGELTWKSGSGFWLRPLPGTSAPVARGALRTIEDPDYAHLRDAVAGAIARRMAACLERGEAVTWTRKLRFLPTGLEVRAGGGLPLLIPYRHVRYETAGAAFALFRGRESAPLLRTPLGAANAFPGLALLDRLRGVAPEVPATARPETFQLPREQAFRTAQTDTTAAPPSPEGRP